MDLSLRAHADAGPTVLEVAGEVDVYSAPSLGTRIDEILASGERHLVVDVNHVGFIDSTGLGVLVTGYNRAREQQSRLDLVCAVERIAKLLRITGLDDVFTVYPSVQEAVSGSADAT